ncbi:hypothetical protein [Nonomuraea jabiensis]|uniref:hypothetical protein n=1 Tax=Nonomuraea jabiensis TaxID=882448 RepID=UPI003D74ADA9
MRTWLRTGGPIPTGATWLAAAHWWGPMPLAVGACVVAGYALVVVNNILIQHPVTTRGSLVAEWLPWLLSLAAGATAWVTRAWKRPPSRPERVRDRRQIALGVVRTAVVTAAPLSGVLLLQPILGLDAPILGWAKVVGAGWAVAYLLLSLDPSIRDKVDVFGPFLGVAREGARVRDETGRDTRSAA